MARKIYTLTDKDLAKAAKFAAQADNRKERTEANPSGYKKVQAAKRRAASMDALKGDPEYHRGIWQARIDRANGLDYGEERNDSAYNLGYYRGYQDYDRDLKGGLAIPREYL